MSNKGLTKQALDALGLFPFTTDTEGKNTIASLGRDTVPILFSEDGRNELRRLWDNKESWQVQLFAVAFESLKWRYNKVNSGVKGIAEAVYVPKYELTPEGIPLWSLEPPTAAEIVLVRAWNTDTSFINWSSEQSSGCVIVVAPSDTDKTTILLAGALLGANTVPVHAVEYPAAITVNEWTAQDKEVVYERSVVRDLLGIALAQDKLTQRFMAFYRVLEHLYLGEMYEQLQREFYNAPKDVLESITKKLAKEPLQLQNLVENRNAKEYFEQIAETYRKMKTTNRFAAALRQATRGNELNNESLEKWQQGVTIVYKVRCAIAHAGEGSPVYEAYNDAADFVECTLVDLEDACFRILGLAY